MGKQQNSYKLLPFIVSPFAASVKPLLRRAENFMHFNGKNLPLFLPDLRISGKNALEFVTFFIDRRDGLCIIKCSITDTGLFPGGIPNY